MRDTSVEVSAPPLKVWSEGGIRSRVYELQKQQLEAACDGRTDQFDACSRDLNELFKELLHRRGIT